jgi:hypothetical protein
VDVRAPAFAFLAGCFFAGFRAERAAGFFPALAIVWVLCRLVGRGRDLRSGNNGEPVVFLRVQHRGSGGTDSLSSDRLESTPNPTTSRR